MDFDAAIRRRAPDLRVEVPGETRPRRRGAVSAPFLADVAACRGIVMSGEFWLSIARGAHGPSPGKSMAFIPLPAHVGDELLIRLFLLGVPVDLD